MDQQSLIKVLWIEDDKDFYVAFAARYEDKLNIDWYPNWDEGYAALNNNRREYQAIILDAKCKHHANDIDRATRFMPQVQSDLNAFFAKTNRLIPWYVLTGGDTNVVSELINEDRKEWDGDWTKVCYNKGQDEETLVERIVKYCNSNLDVRVQIKTLRFADVFDAINEIGLSDEIENYMIELLEPTVAHVKPKDYNDKSIKARKVVEAVFIDMKKSGFLNPALLNNGRPILTQVSLVMMGERAKIEQSSQAKKLRDLSQDNCKVYGAVPKIMAENIKNIIHSCGNGAHVEDVSHHSRSYSLKEYQGKREATPYLLISYAYQLCDFLLWYRDFKHKNIRKN